jgi:hypothetical protein
MGKRYIAGLFILFDLTVALPVIHAQGFLLSTYKVVLEGNRLREDLTIANTGNDTAVYALSMSNYRMTETGEMSIPDKTDTLFNADKYLKFFPRRVSLAPHQSQIIRLQARRTAGMQEGEYRTYLNFQADKKKGEDADFGSEQKEQADSAGFSVNVKTVLVMSIPVVVRIGNLSAEATLSDAGLKQLSDTTHQLVLTINRTGNKSVSGKLTVQFVPDNGKTIDIGKAEGVTVYTEIPKRVYTLTLQTKGIKLKAGKLMIRYTGMEAEKEKLFATLEYPML